MACINYYRGGTIIKSASVYTESIDDIMLAVSELESQLKEKLTLLKNSVGIIQCDPEFIEAGIMELLYDTLKIPLTGGTTVSSATNEGIGGFMFSMLVLTSNEVDFVVSHTTDISKNYEKAIRSSVLAATSCSSKPLALAVMFPSITDNDSISGDFYIDIMGEVCPDIPVFGTFSVDEDLGKFGRSMSVFNGSALQSELSYLLIFGDVKPRFFVGSAPKRSLLITTEMVVTRCENGIIQEINDKLAANFFESLELSKDGKLNKGIDFLPILVSVKDKDGKSRTFVRAIIELNSQGFAICRGNIPKGAVLSFASLLKNDILQATKNVVLDISKEDNINAALVFSCIIRQMNIGADLLRELSYIKDSLQDKVEFISSYSGGEISPVTYNNEEISQNSFHNYSIVACVL